MRRLLLVFAFLRGLLRARPRDEGSAERIVEPGRPERGPEALVVSLLVASSACAIAFVVIYALDGLRHQTQYLGLAMAACLALLAAALIVAGQHLVVDEHLEEDYPEPEHPEAVEEVTQIVSESGSRITRKRLLLAAGGLAGGSLGAALVTPALSTGPVLDTESLFGTPWTAGKRLVDESGRPYKAGEIERETFYTAFPEGGPNDEIGSPVVVVRLDEGDLQLPPERRGWAPGGILAYSKICTHAACAIALYRKPTFAPTQPRPALVCPCHYSTFDPATGGEVLFGPAGRPLPQLPLVIDALGGLRAAGNFSGPVGPSFSSVRERGARRS